MAESGKLPDAREEATKLVKAMLIGAAPDDYIVAKFLADFQQRTKLATYVAATKLAMHGNQVVGEKGEYYITLRQLERLAEEAGRQR